MKKPQKPKKRPSARSNKQSAPKTEKVKYLPQTIRKFAPSVKIGPPLINPDLGFRNLGIEDQIIGDAKQLKLMRFEKLDVHRILYVEAVRIVANDLKLLAGKTKAFEEWIEGFSQGPNGDGKLTKEQKRVADYFVDMAAIMSLIREIVGSLTDLTDAQSQMNTRHIDVHHVLYEFGDLSEKDWTPELIEKEIETVRHRLLGFTGFDS